MRRWISWLLTLTLMLTPCVCSAEASAPAAEKNASLRLLKTLYAGQNTLVFSPLSLTSALSMASEGAQGDTRQQLDAVLGKTPEWDFFMEDMAFSGVSMAGAAFTHPDLILLPEYEDLLDDVYDAHAAPMVPGGVKSQVNEWVADATDGLISGLLDTEPDSRTMLLLINALTLKAEWESPFSPAQTGFSIFHSPDGNIEVSTMRQTSEFAYGNHDGVQAISLPYRNSLLQMTVFMPEDGNLAPLVDALCQSPDQFLKTHLPTEKATVSLSLPNIRAESTFELSDALMKQGVQDAFDPARADFSAMAENADELDLHIGSVLQKAVLRVDESGTEAAAATQVAMMADGAFIEETVEMHVDKPFLILINDPGSGYVLFAACINNPA